MHLTSISNFRDVGGATTADGRRVRTRTLFRSGHLAEASDDDLRTLERAGLRTVIDLRGPSDVAAEGPDRLPAGARLVAIPMFEREGPDVRALIDDGDAAALHDFFSEGSALDMMIGGAANLVTSPVRCEEYALLLESIVAQDAAPSLIHCSAGKDRTGWAASLVLATLGVDRSFITAHYLESNEHRQANVGDRVEGWQASGIDIATLEPFFGVHVECIDASFSAVEQHWGGLDGYLYDGLRVSTDVIDRLRSLLLEAA